MEVDLVLDCSLLSYIVQFCSPLVWGSRGREFDSRHSDQRWLSRSAGASNPKGFDAFCFLRLQSRQRLLQAVGDGALAAYVQMAVDVCGHLDVRVAQPLLHILQAVALRQQHAGAGVAQVVKPDVGQVALLQQLVEGVAHVVRGVGMPVLPGEHVVVVYVILAEVVAVVLLLL